MSAEEETPAPAEDQKALEKKPIPTVLVDAGDLQTLVEVFGLEGKIHPVGADELFDESIEKVDANGMRGQVLGHAFMEGLYVVETSDGLRLAVQGENIRPFFDYDVCWNKHLPSDGQMESSLVQCLATKGFCVIDVVDGASSSLISSSLQTEIAGLEQAPRSFYHEEVEPMLGADNNTTVFELEADAMGAAVFGGALAALDLDLSNLSSLISSPLSAIPDLDSLWGRTNNLLRVPRASVKALQTLEGASLQDVGALESYLEWLRARKICMLYLVQNDGGYLELVPHSGDEPTKLSLCKSRLVVFRHDQMSYSYQPEGPSVAIQTWLTTEPMGVTLIELPQPPRPADVSLHVMSAMERFPIGCYGTNKVWTMFMSGGDGQAPIPFTRFDIAEYCMDADNAIEFGKAYTCHGALLKHDHAIMFDNLRFGMPDEEAAAMGVQQRWVIETGYEALYKAGFNLKNLPGQHIGTFTGDYMEDIHQMRTNDGIISADLIQNGDKFAYTAGRLSFTFGFHGPICHCDTACSASMVGINAACNMMRTGTDGRQQILRNSVCLGVVAALHPVGWISMCAGVMLSRNGRCFTFDTSANGFIRGEGCAAVDIQAADPAFQGEFDQRGRLSYVGGTACNQDGKSASLTAPSGPAQQETIRISLRAGNIDPLECTIGDCHGTGTALGDPIEFGANKAVLGVKGRNIPNTLVSSKAHLGHTEATAGICGFIKITMMLLYSTSTPNPHIRVLNSHIGTEGYPVQFGSEPVDNGVDRAFGGLFSFGFGGTNTRADVWARAMKGARKDKPLPQVEYEALRMIKSVAEENFLPTKMKIQTVPSTPGMFSYVH